MTDDTRDKVIALESDVKHLTDKIDTLSKQVTEIHDLLQQARGAKWMLIAFATLGGAIVSKAATFLMSLR